MEDDAENFRKLMEELQNASKTTSSGHGGGSAKQLQQVLPVILAELDQYTEIVDQVIDNYSPKLAEYAERLRKFSVEQDIKTYNELVDAGMEADLAVQLMTVRKQTFTNASQNISKSLK